MDTNRLFISFYLNKQRANNGECPIYLHITIVSKREAVNTAVSVRVQNWDSVKGRIKGNAEDAFTNNKLLAAFNAKATEIYTECLKQNLTITSHLIKSKLTSQGEQSEHLMWKKNMEHSG
jgi:hypothetical protein